MIIPIYGLLCFPFTRGIPRVKGKSSVSKYHPCKFFPVVLIGLRRHLTTNGQVWSSGVVYPDDPLDLHSRLASLISSQGDIVQPFPSLKCRSPSRRYRYRKGEPSCVTLTLNTVFFQYPGVQRGAVLPTPVRVMNQVLSLKLGGSPVANARHNAFTGPDGVQGGMRLPTP